MNQNDAQQFAQEWVRSWNAGEVDAILEHFADEVTFTSPLAQRLVPESGGVIRGKAALRSYWTEGLRRNPSLEFELVAVYTGVGSVVINFRNETGALANEVLIFAGDRVIAGYGTYLSEPASMSPGALATTPSA